MLRTTNVDPSAIVDLVVVEDSTIDRVSNSKLNKAKIYAKMTKSKGLDKS